jgi:hypothetical protein
MIVAVMIAILGLVVGSPAGNVNAKKHTKCFLDGQVSGKGPKAFDADRFTHCGKNYQDGFPMGCNSTGNNAQGLKNTNIK